MKINERQQKILLFISQNDNSSSSQVYRYLIDINEKTSLITTKRDLRELVDLEYLEKIGDGRSVVYSVNRGKKLFLPIDAEQYNLIDVDKRSGNRSFDFSFFEKIPESLFSEEEMNALESCTTKYLEQTKDMSEALYQKELERFVIELSWKSSQIEGNTYTLLDTQLLIEKGIEAEGHNKEEVDMILNHKEAFNFVMDNMDLFQSDLRIGTIEQLHKIIVDKFDVVSGLRERAVGVTGTTYTPLDNLHQIKEALEKLIEKINNSTNAYDKALLALVGISYIQPFEDGNKRVARILANAFLIAGRKPPLSYRNVEIKDYKSATLLFYETLSIIAMKNIFVNQIKFSSENYRVVV